MPRRYLFGPVTAAFADQHLHAPRQAGVCRAFNATGDLDLTIRPGATWEAVVEQLPAAERPEFIVLFLPYSTTPECLWSAPLPLVGLAADWNLLWHGYRQQLRRCDLVLTDTVGVETLGAQGVPHARVANLYGCGRSFLEEAGPEPTRDIDVLFVGNLHPAVQRERLAWLGRLAQLSDRYRVVVRTGVFGTDYRQLLRRARIVFNRSIRGEANQRAFEAAACGALLFQEAANREIEHYFADRRECVLYRDGDLEALLTYYLEHADERQAIAAAAQAEVAQCSYERQWQRVLDDVVGPEWDTLVERSRQRVALTGPDALRARTWQLLGSTDAGDTSLATDLAAALKEQPGSTALLNAQGLVLTRVGQGHGPVTAALAAQALECFRRAVHHDPTDVVAELNLVEALCGLGQRPQAVDQAQRTLALLEGTDPLDATLLDGGHFPPAFDLFRVEWERAAWANAGQPDAEAEAKRTLLRWRLHTLLAELTGEQSHYFAAALLRPDLGSSKAALGCALARAGRVGEAVPHLQQAVAGNPFDRAAARALCQALADSGNRAAQIRLVAAQRLLHCAAPQAVPAEPWFSEGAAPGPTAPAQPTSPAPLTGGIIWEGSVAELHSLALVNREVCRRLIERGHDVSLRPLAYHPDVGVPTVPLPAVLQERVGRPPVAPSTVHVRHRWPPDLTPPPTGHWVMMQPWEFGSLPRNWVEPMVTQVDEVWVYTHWLRNCYVRSGVPAAQVQVVPLGVDPQRFHPGAPPLRLQTSKRYRFLFVGGTIHRKGIDLLLRAYIRNFTAQDDVCLVIKDLGGGTFYRGQTAQQQIAQLQAQPAAPAIEYIDQPLTDDQLAGLYRACDCLVHAYRGEGFGLPIAEAMACALPVIVTGSGAALDFCNPTNAFLLPARDVMLPEARVGDLETVDRPWLAEPDLAALADTLRWVVAHPEEAQAKGQIASSFIRRHFTWEQTADAVATRLAVLRDRPVRRRGAHETATTAVVPVVPHQAETADAVARALAVAPSFVVTAGMAVAARPRVSLCLIVKNEEANLPACLGSASGLCEEIIVVDTGSTDRTKELAAGYGAKVFDFPWVDSFAAARNECLKHATGQWIFWLDADDRLDEANRDKLHRLFGALRDEGVAYAMKCVCLPDPIHGTVTVVDHIRLFPNHPQVRWQYRVHEQILPAIRRLGGQVRFADVVIQHTGYQDPALRGRKLERDLRLLHVENSEKPDDPFTLFNLGSVYQEVGKHAEALPLLRRSLERSQPNDSIVRKLYALIAQGHRQAGQPGEALTACQEGRRYYPDDAELLFQEAVLRREQGDLRDAEACLLRLLDTREAEHFASVAVGLRGYKARANLAIVYGEHGRWPDAEVQWRAVLAEQPGFVPAWLGLADVFLAQDRFDDAGDSCRQALRQQPGEAYLHARLGEIHVQQGRLADAQACFREAVRLQPTYAAAHSSLLMCLNYDPDATADELSAAHRRWAEQHARMAPLGPAPDHDRVPDRRLRIGYVSPDLRRHAVARFLEPILAHHDPVHVEVFAYTDVTVPDALTQRLQERCAAWRPISGRTDAQVAEQVRADHIDILVDLAGHTGNRLGVFARKPAPVQVSYLGYPHATGLPTIDCRLTDAVADPVDAMASGSEALVRLPGGFCCYQPPASVPDVGPLPLVQAGHVTLGSLHQLVKLNGRMLDLWCDVLHAIPSARLLVARHTLTGTAVDSFRDQFRQRDIGDERVELRTAPPDGRHWELYRDIDIALDTSPWNGHTTACEALWMGVPVLTLAGDRFAGRMVTSVLRQLELNEWIAHDRAAFVAQAVRLAGDAERLAGLRAGLRQRMRQSRVCDGATFTRQLEQAYRTLWRRWVAANPPEPGRTAVPDTPTETSS